MSRCIIPLRIYISGKITGDKDYLQHFKQAEDYLKTLGFTTIINPANMHKDLRFDKYDSYMKLSLEELKECDCIYLLNNYKTSKGANIERNFANVSGKCILKEEWDDVKNKNILVKYLKDMIYYTNYKAQLFTEARYELIRKYKLSET